MSVLHFISYFMSYNRVLSVPRSCEDNCTGCQSASE